MSDQRGSCSGGDGTDPETRESIWRFAPSEQYRYLRCNSRSARWGEFGDWLRKSKTPQMPILSHLQGIVLLIGRVNGERGI